MLRDLAAIRRLVVMVLAALEVGCIFGTRAGSRLPNSSSSRYGPGLVSTEIEKPDVSPSQACKHYRLSTHVASVEAKAA